MSFLLSCPCGKKFRLKDTPAGKRVKCPICGRRLTVGDRAPKTKGPAKEAPDDEVAEDEEESPDEEQESPDEEPSAERRPGWFALPRWQVMSLQLVLGLLLMIFLIGAMIVCFRRAFADPAQYDFLYGSAGVAAGFFLVVLFFFGVGWRGTTVQVDFWQQPTVHTTLQVLPEVLIVVLSWAGQGLYLYLNFSSRDPESAVEAWAEVLILIWGVNFILWALFLVLRWMSEELSFLDLFEALLLFVPLMELGWIETLQWSGVPPDEIEARAFNARCVGILIQILLTLIVVGRAVFAIRKARRGVA